MGIIQKQSTRSSFFLFIGFCVGAINLLILFPKFFTQEEIGLTRAIIDTGTILSMLATLGITPVIYKFAPIYRSHLNAQKNDLPFISGMVCLIGFILIVAFGLIFKEFIIRKLGKAPLFGSYFYLVYPFTFFMLIFSWMEAFGWSLKKTTSTNFLKETLIRVLTTVLILLTGFGLLTKNQFVYGFSFIYVMPVLLLLVILLKSNQWKFNFKISTVTRRFKSKMAIFGLYVFGATFLGVVARTVDSFMIIGLKGLAQTAVFTIASYLVAFMDLPLRSIVSIATPILSESWKDKKMENILSIYKKSTITLLVTGLFIYCCVLLNAKNLVGFLGKEWEAVPMIVMIMGMAKLIDLGTGVNGQIIGTSINWRFDFFTNVLLTLIAFPLNFILISKFGIIGAAFSNLAAVSVYNFIRFLFIYRKYGWQPYSFEHIKILFVSLLIFLLVYVVPEFSNIYIDAVFRTTLFAGLFIPAMFRMNISPEINQTVENIGRKVGILKSRRM